MGYELVGTINQPASAQTLKRNLLRRFAELGWQVVREEDNCIGVSGLSVIQTPGARISPSA